MTESKLRDISTDFAVKIIKLCETIKGHYSLVNQLERSATSIGANIHEANCAHGKPTNSKAYNRRRAQAWKKDLPDLRSCFYRVRVHVTI